MVGPSSQSWEEIKVLFLFTSGPDVKPAEEKIIKHLMEVVVGVAKGITNKIV